MEQLSLSSQDELCQKKSEAITPDSRNGPPEKDYIATWEMNYKTDRAVCRTEIFRKVHVFSMPRELIECRRGLIYQSIVHNSGEGKLKFLVWY